jgi:hypothetical protein
MPNCPTKAIIGTGILSHNSIPVNGQLGIRAMHRRTFLVARKQHCGNSRAHSWSGTTPNRPRVPLLGGGREDRSSLINGKHGGTCSRRHLEPGYGRTFVPNGNDFAPSFGDTGQQWHSNRRQRTLFDGLPIQVEDCSQPRHSVAKPRISGERRPDLANLYIGGVIPDLRPKSAGTACPRLILTRKREIPASEAGLAGGCRHPTRPARTANKPRFAFFVRR